MISTGPATGLPLLLLSLRAAAAATAASLLLLSLLSGVEEFDAALEVITTREGVDDGAERGAGRGSALLEGIAAAKRPPRSERAPLIAGVRVTNNV